MATVTHDNLLLITGASGFVGSALVRRLLEAGHRNLRCLVRTASGRARLDTIIREYPSASIEVMHGNLLAPADCREAVRGVSVIYHLAAGSGKSFSACVLDSAVTTRNLLEAVVGAPDFRRFVNVSSFSVYSNRSMRRGAVLDETCPVDQRCMARWDAYAFGKVKQDEIALWYSKERNVPVVIMRPGIVFGPGRGGTILGRSGWDSLGLFVHVSGSQLIPLTYVENCCDAIMRAGMMAGIAGEVFNVVDDNLPRSSELVRRAKRELGSFTSLRVPYHLFYLFCWLWESYAKWSQNQLPPILNRRMCAVYYQGNCYPNSKLKKRLGWKPLVPMDEALTRYFADVRTRQGRRGGKGA